MTDSTKWKSIMVRKPTYIKIRDIALRDKRAVSSILTELIDKEWEWQFNRENIQPEPNQIQKDPERRVTNQGPRNPFLINQSDSGVD